MTEGYSWLSECFPTQRVTHQKIDQFPFISFHYHAFIFSRSDAIGDGIRQCTYAPVGVYVATSLPFIVYGSSILHMNWYMHWLEFKEQGTMILTFYALHWVLPASAVHSYEKILNSVVKNWLKIKFKTFSNKNVKEWRDRQC